MSTRPDPGDPYDIDPFDDTPTNPGTGTADAGGGQWWPRLADRINRWWIHHEPAGPALRDIARIIPRPVLAAAGAVLVLAVLLVWWLVAALVGLVSGIADAVTAGAHTAGNVGTGRVVTAGLTRTITDPVHTYLTAHATGLPVSVHTLWTTWLATTGALFLLAALGSRGARIGWTITGALTTAMVYTATGGPGRAVAAGLTVTVWALLSVAALNRYTGGMRVPVLRLHLPHRPARPDTD